MKVPLDFDVALNKRETICPHCGVFTAQGPTSYPSVTHQGRCQKNEPNILDDRDLLGFSQDSVKPADADLHIFNRLKSNQQSHSGSQSCFPVFPVIWQATKGVQK